MVLVPLHATPTDQPPPLTPVRLLTEWTWEWAMALGIAVAGGLYIAGLVVLYRRGDHWPVRRSVSFLLGGLGSIGLATMSALGTYDTVLLSIHMVQHMILMMVAPMFLALGAPITLALRTLAPRPRAMLLAVLHSRVARVLTFAPLTLALFIATPFALYYSSFYELSLRSGFWHAFLHLHFIIIGALLMWPLMGIDPVPGRISYPLRVLMMFLMLPFHDQYLAGGILWASGDAIALVMMIVLFVQWYASSQREARREDRRLDRLERLQRATTASVAPGDQAQPARYDHPRGTRAVPPEKAHPETAHSETAHPVTAEPRAGHAEAEMGTASTGGQPGDDQ
jgi:cytochrome c oxidase assembly factor CtaG